MPKAPATHSSRKPPEPSADHADVADWLKRVMPDLQPIVDHLDRQIEPPHHVPNHDQLLVVLLAENRQVRLHAVEKLEDDGSDAMEEARPEAALEFVRQRARLDQEALRLGV